MKLLLPFARRFVAGMDMKSAIDAVEELNRQQVLCSLDILGESVYDAKTARLAADTYVSLLHEIENRNALSNVSVKVSQMGIEIDPQLAYDHMELILNAAKATSNTVRLDMEGSKLTQATLDIFWRLREKFDNVGIVLQAYLMRTEKDVDLLIDRGGTVRICKGAYRESGAIAFQAMADIRNNFLLLVKKLFQAVKDGKNVNVAIATHDDQVIDACKQYVSDMEVPVESFEFQMLYGMRRGKALELAKNGYQVRTYVPYGPDWFPYFYRRLRERKENVFFVLKNLFRS